MLAQRFTNITDALPEFRCQGVALGQAFASPLTGDAVATVLVGGMMTVMNGHFEMFAGTSPPTDVLRPFRHARLLTCASRHRRRRTMVFRFRKGQFLRRFEFVRPHASGIQKTRRRGVRGISDKRQEDEALRPPLDGVGARYRQQPRHEELGFDFPHQGLLSPAHQNRRERRYSRNHLRHHALRGQNSRLRQVHGRREAGRHGRYNDLHTVFVTSWGLIIINNG